MATADYDAFAREVRKSGVVTDPWVEGKPRLREEPVVLQPGDAARLSSAAESIAAVYDEMVHLVLDAPELADFFALTPFQLAMWQASAPMWHGIARADFFETDEGLVMAELNCDTPTGEPEAVVLGAIARASDGAAIDPDVELEPRFLAMVDAIARRELDAPPALRHRRPRLPNRVHRGPRADPPLQALVRGARAEGRPRLAL